MRAKDDRQDHEVQSFASTPAPTAGTLANALFPCTHVRSCADNLSEEKKSENCWSGAGNHYVIQLEFAPYPPDETEKGHRRETDWDTTTLVKAHLKGSWTTVIFLCGVQWVGSCLLLGTQFLLLPPGNSFLQQQNQANTLALGHLFTLSPPHRGTIPIWDNLIPEFSSFPEVVGARARKGP